MRATEVEVISTNDITSQKLHYSIVNTAHICAVYADNTATSPISRVCSTILVTIEADNEKKHSTIATRASAANSTCSSAMVPAWQRGRERDREKERWKWGDIHEIK